MAMKFDKDKIMEAVETVHTKLNKDVIEATQEAWSVFSSMEDENPQKAEMKESVTKFQDSYNSLTEQFDGLLKNLDAIQELHGRLSKYEVNQVQNLQADGVIEEINIDGVIAP